MLFFSVILCLVVTAEYYILLAGLYSMWWFTISCRGVATSNLVLARLLRRVILEGEQSMFAAIGTLFWHSFELVLAIAFNHLMSLFFSIFWCISVWVARLWNTKDDLKCFGWSFMVVSRVVPTHQNLPKTSNSPKASLRTYLKVKGMLGLHYFSGC